MLDDIDAVEAKLPFSTIHVLTKEDAQYLGGEYDNISEMVVSAESPLGKELLGLRRGDTKEYFQNQRLQVMDTEDAITPSYLFDR